MLQILYVSTARILPTEAVLDDILAASRRKNRAGDITGLLVSGGRRFLQVLEGPEHAVLATIDRIGRDSRHYAIVELSRRAIEARAFGNWSMGYRRGGAAADPRAIATIAELIGGVTDKNLRAQFAGFAKLHNLAA